MAKATLLRSGYCSLNGYYILLGVLVSFGDMLC